MHFKINIPYERTQIRYTKNNKIYNTIYTNFQHKTLHHHKKRYRNKNINNFNVYCSLIMIITPTHSISFFSTRVDNTQLPLWLDISWHIQYHLQVTTMCTGDGINVFQSHPYNASLMWPLNVICDSFHRKIVL